MAPTRNKKKGSTESSSSQQKSATYSSSGSPSTPQRSPIQKKRTGINMQQKQALIENLRLEITERARRLRAQYHLQAQGLRSRVEIRLNRIPTAVRRATMGELLLKYAEQAQRAPAPRPLPVPVKDLPLPPSPQKPIHQTSRAPQVVGRAQKRLSDEITRDKENENVGENPPKKKARGGDAGVVRPAQVLSPTSSNSRLANRSRATSPTKSYLYKASSPLKGGSPARPTAAAAAAGARAGGLRKVTTTSNSSASSATPTTRTKRIATAAPKGLLSRPGTRTTRRASDVDESSDGSANTVLRKAAGMANTAAARKAAPGSVQKAASRGVAKSTAKAGSAGSAGSAAATGRILRKRI
ncbi:hypothetical protein ACHAPE_007090 [Trichoderma viride]